jgi:hypothetical protein
VIRTSALVDWTSDQLAEAGETVKVVRSRGVETGFPSQPTEDRRDEARRTHLTCNYLIQLARY